MSIRGRLTVGVALAIVIGAVAPGDAAIEGPQMVGVGLPPDSVSFTRDTNHCVYSPDYDPGPGFRLWEHLLYPDVNGTSICLSACPSPVRTR